MMLLVAGIKLIEIICAQNKKHIAKVCVPRKLTFFVFHLYVSEVGSGVNELVSDL